MSDHLLWASRFRSIHFTGPANDDETGLAEVEEAEGRKAVQVGVGVSFDADGAARAHLGFFTGDGFGVRGFVCPLARESSDVWSSRTGRR